MSAIRIKAKKAEGEHDLGTSKFLGNPVLPEELTELDESIMFLMQINLEEIKDLDTENILPHKGYLYFFLDTANGEYDLKPIVKYYDGEPTYLVDNYNSIVDGFEDLVDEYLITFEKCDDSEPGNKLLGVPSDWNYEDESKKLLFQYDPLDNEFDFLSFLDGYLYFFFHGDDYKDFDNIELMEEYS